MFQLKVPQFNIHFVSGYFSEADPLVGWSKSEVWRADATYAGLVVKVRIDGRVYARGVRFGPKVFQIGPKLDKSVTFSDQISVHFGSMSQMY